MLKDAQQVHADGDVTYTPWTDGHAIGYKVESPGREAKFIYLNPSSDDTDDIPNVFVYLGTSGHPATDVPTGHYYSIWPDE